MEESKRLDESEYTESNRLTIKEKVAKLKNDLKKRKAMLRGEIDNENPGDDDVFDDIQIDTSKQE